MAGTTTCSTCGQANADGTEYCVRCGTRMPDPSSTQLVNTAGQGAEEYPWEPPAEWDPGDLPAGGAATPAPTWVANPQDQVGWNTGHDTGPGVPAGGQPTPQWGAPGGQVPPGYPPTPPPGRPGGSRKPLIIGATAVVVIAAIVAVVLVATGGKKKTGAASNGGGGTSALNGVQNESGTDALSSAREAFRAASSVQITGSLLNNGQPVRLDLTLATGNDSEGTLTINNADVQLIKIDQTVFVKGDMDFLKKYAGNNTAVLSQLNGKWLKTNTTTDFDLVHPRRVREPAQGRHRLVRRPPESHPVDPERAAGRRRLPAGRIQTRHRQHRPGVPAPAGRQGQQRRHPHLHQLQQGQGHHRPTRQRRRRRQRQRHPARRLHLHRPFRFQRRDADPARQQLLHGEWGLPRRIVGIQR